MPSKMRCETQLQEVEASDLSIMGFILCILLADIKVSASDGSFPGSFPGPRYQVIFISAIRASLRTH